MQQFRIVLITFCLSLLFINITGAQDDEFPVISAENATAIEQIGIMGGDQGRITVSPDNHWMAISGLQGVWVVDLAAGDENARLFAGHTDKVNSTAFDPTDSNHLVSVSDDGTIREWDVATGESLRVIEAQEAPIFGVDIDPTGRLIAAASGSVVRIISLETGEEIRQLGDIPVGFRRVTFIKDSPLVIAGTFNSSLAIWNLGTEEFVGEINNNFNGDVQAVRVSADGTKLAVAMLSGRVVTSTLATGEQLVLDYHTDGVRDVMYSPNGRLLASVGMDKKVLLMDAVNGDLLNEIELDEFTYSLAFSSDSRLIYVASADGRVSTWDIERNQIVQERSLRFPNVRQVAYSPNGRFVAAVTDEDSVGRVFNALTNRQVAVLKANDERVLTLAYRIDGRVIATAGSGGDVHIWRTDRFELADTLTTNEDRIYSLAFTPDTSVIATGGESAIRLWNLPEKEQLFALDNETPVWDLSISPDGSLIAAPGGLWNAFTREKLPIEISEFASVAISPNSDFLATSDKLIPIEIDRIRPAATGYVGLSNAGVAFSPDGSLVAMAIEENIQIIDVTTQTVITTITGHTADVRSLAFSPDGTRLVSGGFDATIRQWAVVGDVLDARIPPIGTDGAVFNRMPDDILTPTITDDILTLTTISDIESTSLRQAITNVVDLDVAPDGSSAVFASLNGVFYIDLNNLTIPPVALLPTEEAIFPSGLAVDYSMDGTQVAVSHGFARSQEAVGGGITLWDVRGDVPQLIDQFLITGDRGFSVALSPNKQFIGIGFDGSRARILDIPSGSVVSETEARLASRVNGITFSPDNLNYSVSDTAGNKVFYNTITGALLGGFNSGVAVPMWWSPDNTYLYSAEQTGFILRDGFNTEPIQENPYPEDVVGDIKATDVAAGQLMIAGEDNIWILDYQTGEITQTITGFESIITTAEFTLDSQQIVAVTNDNRLRIWDIETGLQIDELQLGFIDSQAAIAVSDDGQYVAIGNRDISIRILSAETGELLRTIETDQTRPLHFLPNSPILTTAEGNNIVNFWDVRTGQILEPVNSDGNRIVTISDDGTYVITRKDRNLLTLQNVQTGTILFEDKQVHLSQFNDADISIAENLMATAGADGVVKLWDLRDREQDALIRAHDNGVDKVAFSPVGTLLATMGDDGIRVWDYRPIFNILEQFVFTLPIERANALYFSLDGTMLFAHVGDTLHIWSMDNGIELANLTVPDGVSMLTADGTHIIAVDTQGSISSIAAVPTE